MFNTYEIQDDDGSISFVHTGVAEQANDNAMDAAMEADESFYQDDVLLDDRVLPDYADIDELLMFDAIPADSDDMLTTVGLG